MRYTFVFICLLAFSLHSAEKEDKMKTLLEGYEEFVKTSMSAWNVPGLAITIVKDNQAIFTKGFGVKKIGEKDKVDSHTLFQIGSLSKSFTSALIALTIDEGKLKWNDKVVDHLDQFILYDPWVTREFEVQDLLAMRSGLPPFAGDVQAYLGYNNHDIIRNLRYIKPITSFRAAYAFQNAFFNVAAEVLLAASGKSWENLIQERLFTPLGMKASSVTYDAFVSSKNVVSRHVHVNKKTTALPDKDITLDSVYTYAPAGGVNSTIEDMSQWLKLQINNGIFKETPLVSTENISQTHRRYVYMGKLFGSDQYYGLGWAIRDYSPYPVIWHDGGTTGSSSVMAFIPEENIGIVILSNTKGTSLNYALTWEFFDRYYDKSKTQWSQELLEKQMLFDEQSETPKPLDKPEPSLPLEDYTGIYYNKMYGNVQISQEGEQLVMNIGPKKQRITLKPWNRDTFTLIWPEVPDLANSKVFFNKDITGDPTQLVIEMLEENSDGSFQRLGE